MKKMLLFPLCILVFCYLTACSSSGSNSGDYQKGYEDGYAAAMAEIDQNTSINTQDEAANESKVTSDSEKPPEINDGAYTITTDDGSFALTIVEAHWVTDTRQYSEDDLPSGYGIASLRCIAENIDYSGLYDNLCSFDIWYNKLVRAVDTEGFDCEYYDSIPFEDDMYSVTEVAQGAKAKLCLPLIVPKNTNSLKIIIDGSENISVPIN